MTDDRSALPSTGSGKIIVLAGLPASGKTTLLKRLESQPGVVVVPSPLDWLGGVRHLPAIATTVQTKLEAQRFLMTLDVERHKFAREQAQRVPLVVMDTDFTANLALHHAERRRQPRIDVYQWMIEAYCQYLDRGRISLAEGYVYLDAALAQRLERRSLDKKRKRNLIYFEAPLPDDMQGWYERFFATQTEDSGVNAYWWHEAAPAERDVDFIRALIDELLATGSAVRPEQFKNVLRATL